MKRVIALAVIPAALLLAACGEKSETVNGSAGEHASR